MDENYFGCLLCSLYMKKKYGSEPWLQNWLLSECVSVKDSLKNSIAKPLAKMMVSVFFSLKILCG